jgi:1-acyl-sn-glycerol-3-phosphate acyltransferase
MIGFMLFILRMILIALWGIFSAFCGLIFSMIRPFHPNNPQITAKLLTLLGPKILGLKIIYRHKENLDIARPCVFVSNHQHNIDIFMGCYHLPDRTVSMGKRSLIWVPVFGLFYWLSGNILINRSNKKSAFGTMDAAASAIKGKNTSVWIMPEGTRSKGRGLLPFKKGPFVTAIKADVPIVPVCCSNYSQILNLNKWHSATMIIDVLAPVSTKEFKIEDVNALKDKIYHLMKSHIDILDHEVKKMHSNE